SFNAGTLRSAAVDSLVVNKSLLIFSKYFSSGSILIPIICVVVLISFHYSLVKFDGIELLFSFFSKPNHFLMLALFSLDQSLSLHRYFKFSSISLTVVGNIF